MKYSLEHDNNGYRFFFVHRPLVVALAYMMFNPMALAVSGAEFFRSERSDGREPSADDFPARRFFREDFPARRAVRTEPPRPT